MTNTTYKTDATFQHVYAHHDSKSRGELTIEAKLKIVRDKLAGQ